MDGDVIFGTAYKGSKQFTQQEVRTANATGFGAAADDYAERDTVISMGGMASSCLNFIQTVENTLNEQQRDIKNYNRRERTKFKNPR